MKTKNISLLLPNESLGVQLHYFISVQISSTFRTQFELPYRIRRLVNNLQVISVARFVCYAIFWTPNTKR